MATDGRVRGRRSSTVARRHAPSVAACGGISMWPPRWVEAVHDTTVGLQRAACVHMDLGMHVVHVRAAALLWKCHDTPNHFPSARPTWFCSDRLADRTPSSSEMAGWTTINPGDGRRDTRGEASALALGATKTRAAFASGQLRIGSRAGLDSWTAGRRLWRRRAALSFLCDGLTIHLLDSRLGCCVSVRGLWRTWLPASMWHGSGQRHSGYSARR